MIPLIAFEKPLNIGMCQAHYNKLKFSKILIFLMRAQTLSLPINPNFLFEMVFIHFWETVYKILFLKNCGSSTGHSRKNSVYEKYIDLGSQFRWSHVWFYFAGSLFQERSVSKYFRLCGLFKIFIMSFSFLQSFKKWNTHAQKMYWIQEPCSSRWPQDVAQGAVCQPGPSHHAWQYKEPVCVYVLSVLPHRIFKNMCSQSIISKIRSSLQWS